ncbi:MULTISPECIES: hypothetical protein [unclassified Carboxylicivirga]|uniref:DUF7935 family protein n=1 Tax=Carboxylicivirga TaxID=1628153 RepID=UPI003D347369
MIALNEILKIVGLVVLISTPLLLLLRWFLKHNLKLKELELANNTYKTLIPTRLQAYERLTILLERINPEALVLRENKQGINCLQLQKNMLQSIRNEFEHNFAMQVYLPTASWDAILRGRDEVIKLINSASAEVRPDAPGLQLARIILEKSINETKFYIDKARETLKKDIQLYYFD